MANPLPEDDLTIEDSSALWRRIHPQWLIPDENRGGMRLTSAAFQNVKGTNSCSVLLAEEMRNNDKDIQDALMGIRGHGLAEIAAGFARTSSNPPQLLVREPTVAEPEHAHIVGPKPKPVRRKLSEGANLLLDPSTPDADDL